jgi:hypothetical protein
MAQPPLNLPTPPQGVIASLAGGFETVNARLELILLPLLLDLFLWLGPRLSILPLVERFSQVLVSELGRGATAEQQAVLAMFSQRMREYGQTFNLFSFLSTAPLGLPSLFAARGSALAPQGQPPVWYVDSVPVYLVVWAAFVLAGLFLGALYFGGIAQQVRDRRLNFGLLLRQVWGDWARLTALAVVAVAFVLVMGTPLFLISVVLWLFSPLVGSLAWIVAFTLLLWALFYGGFSLHAMLLARRGLLGALWDSVRMVQFNLPHVASLFVLAVLINVGLALVWNLPADTSWLMLLGVGGHALISTAVVAATFVFYQDRYRWRNGTQIVGFLSGTQPLWAGIIQMFHIVTD